MNWLNKIVPVIKIGVGVFNGNWGQVAVGATQLAFAFVSDNSPSGTNPSDGHSGDDSVLLDDHDRS